MIESGNHQTKTNPGNEKNHPSHSSLVPQA